MTERKEPVLTETFYLAAGECGPEREMPLQRVVQRVIEVATHHANDIGVGYDDLIAHGQAWVLSRLAVEMQDYPRINEHYSVTTWVEHTNRYFSERNFMIADGEGRALGYARSVWVAIDIERRAVADISRFECLGDARVDRPCPIAGVTRLHAIQHPTRRSLYTFRYSDLDFNRHVNSVRYVEELLNCWDLDFHDTHKPQRLEISFLHEVHCSQTADLLLHDTVSDGGMIETRCDFVVDSNVSVNAKIWFKNRK